MGWRCWLTAYVGTLLTRQRTYWLADHGMALLAYRVRWYLTYPPTYLLVGGPWDGAAGLPRTLVPYLPANVLTGRRTMGWRCWLTAYVGTLLTRQRTYW